MRFGIVKRMASLGRAKRPKLSSKDKSYFDSYCDISIHEEMLGDAERTNAYKNAIFQHKEAIQGKVVLDVGAGTGILSCFCGQAGAAKVYAVEASAMAEQAKKIVYSNNLQDCVEVIHGVMEEVILSEKVDVIVSEWMGYCLLYESMLLSVIYARDKWLKPGGILLPDSATLYLSPICDDEIMVDKVHFWNDMEDTYGVDMSSIIPFARESLSKEVMVKSLGAENILAHEQVVKNFDLYAITKANLSSVKYSFLFRCFGHADLQGFAVWFDVNFCTNKKFLADDEKNRDLNPCDSNNDVKKKSVLLSTSPYLPETHWKQAVLYLKKEMQVVQDSKIHGSIELSPSKDNPRFLSVNLITKIDDYPEVSKHYSMGYDLEKSAIE